MSPDTKIDSMGIDPADLERRVDDKELELLVESMAYARALRHPEFRDAMVRRKTVESDAERAGRGRAADIELKRRREASSFDRYPWGLNYLKDDHAPEAIADRIRANRTEEGPTHQLDEEAEASRAEALDEAITEARGLTLRLGRLTAKKLSRAGVPTDTKAAIVHTSKIKRFSGKGLRLHGQLRSEIPVESYEDTAEGWDMPINGQVDRFARVILCKDGRILVAYPKAEKEEGGKNVLYVDPNTNDELEMIGRLPSYSGPEQSRIKPGNTYSRFIDEEVGSDIGMSSLPVGSPVARAHTILTREQAMQEAVVSLLVDHDIPVTSEPKTAVEQAKPAEPASLSDEEKKYRNEGGEYIDPRFSDEAVDALKGEARLWGVPETIKINNYVMSQVINGELQHFFEYADPANRPAFATLDQFAWTELSPARREELKKAGFDPDDLVAGRHPITKPYW